MYRPVCVGPCRKPRRPVFSRRGSKNVNIKSDISGLFSENSNNACDSFSARPVLNDEAQHSNVNINLTDIKTEITTHAGTRNPNLDDAEDAFFSFFNDNFGENKEMATADQQVVPKLEDRQTCNKESGMFLDPMSAYLSVIPSLFLSVCLAICPVCHVRQWLSP